MKFLCSSLFNLLFFNTMWLLCVLGRNELLWLSVPLLAGYASLLLAAGKMQITQLLLPALGGLTVDSVMVISGLLEFNSQQFLPLWLVLLWLNFSITLGLALQWLKKHFWICAVAGAVAFPLNYSIGEQLNAVSYSAPYPLVISLMAAVWAIGLPGLYQLRLFALHMYSRPGTAPSQSRMELP